MRTAVIAVYARCNWRGSSGWGVIVAGVLLAATAGFAQIPSSSAPQPSVASALMQDAQRKIEAGDFTQAVVLLKQYLAQGEGSAAGHKLLAYSYLRLDDPRESLQEYTKAAALQRPSAMDLQNVAKDYVLLGDFPSADHWLMIAVQMDPHDAESWYALGRVRYSLQRFQEAATCFERSLVLAPRSVKAENNIGLAYEGLNRTDDAMAAYRLAIDWQKNEPHPSELPLLNLGILLLRQEKLDEAEALLTKAEAIAPRDPAIREQLGHVYLQTKRYTEAQRQFQDAIALDPKKAALHFLLGKVYHLEGQEAQAKGEFAIAAAMSGTHSTPEPY
jgi:Tfp pilus assembly protein PilF